MRYKILSYAKNQLASVVELHRVRAKNVVKGCKEDATYYYLPNLNISVQRMSANEVCNVIMTIAEILGTEIAIVFAWCHKEGSLYLGEDATLRMPIRSL